MATKKEYSVSTSACCDKQVPSRARQFVDRWLTLVTTCVLLVVTGCQSHTARTHSELEHVVYPVAAAFAPVNGRPNATLQQPIATAQPRPIQFASPVSSARRQSSLNSSPAGEFSSNTSVAQASYQQPAFQQPVNQQSNFQQPTYLYPAVNPPTNTAPAGSAPQIGFQPRPMVPQSTTGAFPSAPVFEQPQGTPPLVAPPILNGPIVADIDVTIPQGPTGRATVGATYGSNNGLVGQFIIDERDFDILNWPRPQTGGFNRGTWRGGGQTFRAELVPGRELERYLVSWANPYFRGTEFSLSVSGFYFDRRYTDWDEQRAGGRIGLGRALTPFLSLNTALRMESVTIDNPRVMASTDLNSVLGNSNLFLGSIGLEYDTRINPGNNQPDPFLTAQGSYFAMTFKQAFGDYSFSRGDIDFRRHRIIYSRPDGSGRHSLGFSTKLGFSGSSTPVFETYLAGGLSSMRGFEFRGVSPIQDGVRVGGDFQWLNSLEYTFPLTADDMIAGVMFVDFGTVEESVKLNSENFRTAPGLGLRINLPYAGMGAPLAFDWAFPVSTATGDLEQQFSFIVGVLR